jgi:hypothetical protein
MIQYHVNKENTCNMEVQSELNMMIRYYVNKTRVIWRTSILHVFYWRGIVSSLLVLIVPPYLIHWYSNNVHWYSSKVHWYSSKVHGYSSNVHWYSNNVHEVQSDLNMMIQYHVNKENTCNMEVQSELNMMIQYHVNKTRVIWRYNQT